MAKKQVKLVKALVAESLSQMVKQLWWNYFRLYPILAQIFATQRKSEHKNVSVRKTKIPALFQTNSQGNEACNGLNKTCNLGASIIHIMTLSLCNCLGHRDIKWGTEAWVTLMCHSNTSLLDAHNVARSYPFDLWSPEAERLFSQRVQNPREHFKGKRQLKSMKQTVLWFCVGFISNHKSVGVCLII